MSVGEDEGTEDRGQRTEDRGQRAEDRGQRTEVGGQKTEDGGREGTEDRGQMSDVSLRPIGAYAPVGGQRFTQIKRKRRGVAGGEGAGALSVWGYS